MASAWQVKCLRARMLSLQSEILRVKHKDHPYTEPDTVYDALIAVVEMLSHKLRSTERLYAAQNKPIPQSIFNTSAKHLEYVFQFFSYADRVDSPRIPFEILRSLSWVANYLFGETCHTVVRLDPAYNYSLLSCRRIFEKMGWQGQWQKSAENQGYGHDPHTVLLLGFPSPDAGSILVHALAAHEFGHEFHHKWSAKLETIREDIISEIKGRHNQELQDYIASQLIRRDGESNDDAYDRIERYVGIRLDDITRHWLKEIFSDLVAATLVGPAFLAAFDRVSLGFGDASEDYPSDYMRRKLVRTYLAQISPEIVADPVWAVLLNHLGERTLAQDELYRIVEGINGAFCDVVDRLIPMLEKIPSPLPSPLMQEESREFFRMIEAMESHIDNLAPPSVPLLLSNKAGDANKFWLVMYAAWHYRLGMHFDAFERRCESEDEPGKAELVLGNLVLHALQSLELRFRWNKKYPVEEVANGA